MATNLATKERTVLKTKHPVLWRDLKQVLRFFVDKWPFTLAAILLAWFFKDEITAQIRRFLAELLQWNCRPPES